MLNMQKRLLVFSHYLLHCNTKLAVGCVADRTVNNCVFLYYAIISVMMVYIFYVWVNILGQNYPSCKFIDFTGSSRDKSAIVFHA